MMKPWYRSPLILFVAFISSAIFPETGSGKSDRVISLDGSWEITQGKADVLPSVFGHLVPVPGLIDMAEPPFSEVGIKSERREVFWYKRKFRLNQPLPDFVILKIHKVKYGARLYINGQFVDQHWPCFTPATFDIKNFLYTDGRENEIIVAVGADRTSIPEGRPSGWDFEKYRYIPGIYDHVEILLSRSPRIVNIQIIPQPESSTIRVVSEIESAADPWQGRLNYRINEKLSGEIVVVDTSAVVELSAKSRQTITRTLAIENCRLWSPDDPFLYELTVGTDYDTKNTAFGMRTFRFDRSTGRALLNGRPYMMRGTNVCIYRFFEDSLRGDKPWRSEWVRRLHEKFKTMNWNSIRYCIGFPPEEWYGIADELGFLIQDEFPIWLLSKAPEYPRSSYIREEYSDWMRERWNHPCVVIWDAQNESRTPETAKAVQTVRHLDLTNRPWENGWEGPPGPDDVQEIHPYLFIKGYKDAKSFFHFEDIADVSATPAAHLKEKRYKIPVLINEYAWLWLNRDGSPTTLTKNWYNQYFGPQSSAEQRFDLYARYLAALTEFWRSSRQYAGVLHFCGLGYARSGELPRPQGGATSDHFIDLEALTFEPHFEQLVRDAFSAVGLMIDFWQEKADPGQKSDIRLVLLNDLYQDWQGDVTLYFNKEGQKNQLQMQSCNVPSLAKSEAVFSVTFPDQPGTYELTAEIKVNGRKVKSLRRIQIE